MTRRAIASDLVEAAEARLDAFNIDFAEVSADANAKGGREFSKFIALTERPAPLVAVGITSLDLGPQHVRAIAFATESSRDGFRLNFNASADQATHAGAPYPDSDTILRGGKAAWLRALPDDPNIQIGRRSIGDLYPKGSYLYPDNKATIKFPHPFPSQPRVVLWISGMEFSKNNNWRLQASVVNITCDGFTLSAGPWGDSTLYKFDVTWIAHADIPGIQSGVFSTEDVRKTGWALQTAGSTKFTTPFAEQPKVVAALNKFEYGCGRDLTLQTTIKVSAEGLDWSMNSTGDTHQYITSCSYIAFDAVSLRSVSFILGHR